MEADGNGVRADAEDDSGLGLAEAIPCQQAEQFLVVAPESGKRFERRRLDSVTDRGLLGLGAEPETESAAANRAPVLVGDDPPSDRQQPWHDGLDLRQTVDPAPRHGECLGDGVFSVCFARHPAQCVGKHDPVVTLEGGIETPDRGCAHRAPDERRSSRVPLSVTKRSRCRRRLVGGRARSGPERLDVRAIADELPDLDDPIAAQVEHVVTRQARVASSGGRARAMSLTRESVASGSARRMWAEAFGVGSGTT